MVNPITGIGAEALAGLGPMPASLPSAPGQLGDERLALRSGAEVDTRHGAFATRAANKDDAAQVAQTVREVAGALERAQEIVGAMREQVQVLIKNYPPFPPGSEQRLQYLNSISTLRQQLEAMNIPPLDSGEEPVIYPRTAELPALDPERATDAEILDFGARLDGLAQRIETGLGELQRLIRTLPGWGQASLPSAPASDMQASALSREMARVLPRLDAPLMGQREGLTEMGR